MKAFLPILFTLFITAAHAQYAPQAGLPGSTAIVATSAQFTGWATHCTVQRGFMNIADTSLGYASLGDSSAGIGMADDGIVSLGDSGVATLTFAAPIYNGDGADFAVFENGFINVADPSMAFLELAFVEVSSDGVHYFRFPANSLTPVQTQVGNSNYMDASLINNLAGKYIATYGTPFDLDELKNISGLDVNNITHVRVIDVVGSISGHSSYDSAGRIINDPYPTPFTSGGFDLDAVGAIHQVGTGVGQVANNVSVAIYPNPATDNVVITVKGITGNLNATLTDLTGRVLQQVSLSTTANTISVATYPAGMYYLVLYDVNGNKWVEKVIKR